MLIARAAEWGRKNPEKRSASRTAWAQAHPAQAQERQRRRRAKTLGRHIEKIDPIAIADRDEWTCYLCGHTVDDSTFSIDHVVPLARGGDHTPDNVKLAHLRCNQRKGYGTVESYHARWGQAA